MRVHWVRWLIVLLALAFAAWFFGILGPVKDALISLSELPDTRDAFADATTGRTDALIMLVSFFLLSPFAVFVGLLVLVFVLIVVLLLSEPLFRALRLPTWLGVPIVLVGLGYGAYTVRDQWLPQVLYVLGLAARAGVVYFSSVQSVPR